jgi:tetratricopeptide (TPR) repeat protein
MILMASKPNKQLDKELAACRARLGSDPRSALADAQSLLRKTPQGTQLLRIAAAAHRALGERENAERAELTAIQQSAGIPALVSAVAQMNDQEFGEASRLAALHLQEEPDDLAALTLSAEAAIALGVPHKALGLLEEVLTRAPSFMRARVLYANALMLTDRLQDARRIIEPMVKRRPDDAELVNLLSRIQSELGDYASASQTNERLVQIDPKSPEALTNLGDSLRFSGQRDDAVSAYRRAIAQDPFHGRAWWSLADLDASALSTDDVAQIKEALENRTDQPEHAGNLHFALGIACDASEEPDEALQQFSAGNQLRRLAQPYDYRDLSAQIDRYLAAVTAERIPQAQLGNSSGPVPIFVLGMPRAGSTLVERMLGRHSDIEALGELPIAPHMVDRIRQDVGEENLEKTIAGLSSNALESMGQWYVARAQERMSSNRGFFVDKLHMNWRHLPLILRMLPQARIIDIRRDAMDCCWSNFKTLFARGHPAASDMADIGRFYRDYVRQTDELSNRAPGRIHLQDYEALVDSIEGEAATMFDALNIPFEPQVVDFHLSQGPVATASSEQVRQPLNRKGIGAWRPYSQWLGPMKEALGDYAND